MAKSSKSKKPSKKRKTKSTKKGCEETNPIAQAMADASNDGILLIDCNHKVALVNNKLKLWLKWNHINTDSWIGKLDKTVYKHISNITVGSKEINKLFKSVTGTPNLIAQTLNIELKNRTYKYMNVYTSPIFHEVENYLGRLWIFDDRTKEVSVDKMKTEFISIASHQLRTPLSITKGYLAMILGGDAGVLTGPMKEFIESSFTGACRLDEIIEDLLKVSRMEMGKTQPEKHLVSPKEVIDSIVNNYQETAKSKKLTIEENLIFHYSKLKLDDKLLQHAIGNILDNAIKYTPEGKKVFVRAEDFEKKKEKYLHIEIEDQGIGIPPEQKKFIFEKFFRADNVRSEDFSGTGIGLYYVAKIIDALRGKIWFNSELNKGTTFYIQIPE